MRTENLPADSQEYRDLIRSRWGTFKVLRGRINGTVLAYLVDDGRDPCCYVYRKVGYGGELAAQVQAEDMNVWRDGLWEERYGCV